MSDLLSFFDKYTIKARFLPAAMTILPLLFLSASYLNLNKDIIGNIIVLLIASILVIYLLSNLARSLGKKEEERLLNNWGSFPTTQLLRHLDNKIDEVEKLEIHKNILSKFNMRLPNRHEEELDPIQADKLYNVAITKAREFTRQDTILLNDNIYYGFMRNSLGLKIIALALCILTWIILLILFYTHYPYSEYGWKSLADFIVQIRLSIWISLVCSLIAPIYWMFFITEKNVEEAAFRYARRLLTIIQS